MKQTLIAVVLSVALFSAVIFSDQNSRTEAASAILIEGMAHPKAYGMLSELTSIGSRFSGSENYEKAVQWGKAKMISLGFQNVHLQPVKIPHWVRGKVQFAEAKTSSGKTLPLSICALGGSIGTPADGITAEVIEVQSLDEVRMPGLVKGKIVFYNRPLDPAAANTFESYSGAGDQRNRGPAEAAKAGAVAAIVRSLTLALDDFPHTGGTNFKEDVPKIPSVAVSTLDANALSKLLKEEPRLKVTLKLDSQQFPDVDSSNVVGELRGTEFPDEIILVGSHLDSWDAGTGAHDDGAGVVHTLEALSILKRLGFKPKRTIRAVLFANEENGLRGARAYTDIATKQGKHLIGIESDAGGFSPRGFSIKADDSTFAKLQQFKPLLAKVGADELVKGSGGADLYYLSQMGVPAAAFYPENQRYFDYHHSELDTIDKVHPRELELGAVAIAIFSYSISEKGL
jgi:hypothetical protein